MIWISFNKWVFASNILFSANRIYWGKRWCAVPDTDIKFHLFRRRKIKNIETHIQGCMFP